MTPKTPKPRGRARTPDGQLTPREQQIVALLAEGLTAAQTAERLECSAENVRSLTIRAYRRLGVHSAAEAVAVALRKGLIS